MDAIRSFTFFLAVILISAAGQAALAQADDFCSEFGATPSLNSPFAQIPYVFGRVTVKGLDASAKWPKVTVSLVDRENAERRVTVERKGNYCFRRTGSAATLIVDIDGIEAARRSLPSFGATQQREDFEIFAGDQKSGSPGIVSAKFSHPPNEKTAPLYKKAAEAESSGDSKAVISALKEIVTVDPADFIAWAKLGSLQMEGKSFSDAESSTRKALSLQPEYTAAWINAGKIRMANKQYEAAVEVFKHTVSLEPAAAHLHQMLGEAYLLARQGTLGAASLNKALELDPIGMAECHLQLAHLYQLAGAKQLAAKEYAIFLEKKPAHPDKAKLQKFIKENQ